MSIGIEKADSKRQVDAAAIESKLSDIIGRLRDQGNSLERIGNELYSAEPPAEGDKAVEVLGFVGRTQISFTIIYEIISRNNELIDKIEKFI